VRELFVDSVNFYFLWIRAVNSGQPQILMNTAKGTPNTFYARLAEFSIWVRDRRRLTNSRHSIAVDACLMEIHQAYFDSDQPRSFG